MFDEAENATTLELVDTEALRNGAAILSYRVVRYA
jgi:hypothetical protein